MNSGENLLYHSIMTFLRTFIQYRLNLSVIALLRASSICIILNNPSSYFTYLFVYLSEAKTNHQSDGETCIGSSKMGLLYSSLVLYLATSHACQLSQPNKPCIASNKHTTWTQQGLRDHLKLCLSLGWEWCWGTPQEIKQGRALACSYSAPPLVCSSENMKKNSEHCWPFEGR